MILISIGIHNPYYSKGYYNYIIGANGFIGYFKPLFTITMIF